MIASLGWSLLPLKRQVEPKLGYALDCSLVVTQLEGRDRNKRTAGPVFRVDPSDVAQRVPLTQFSHHKPNVLVDFACHKERVNKHVH